MLVLLRKEPSGGAAVHFLKLLKLMADAAHGPEEQPQHGSLLPEYEGDKKASWLIWGFWLGRII